MRRIKSKDTKAEHILRKALWNAGFRYRKNYSKLPGKPDIVLIRYRICVFIDGEFFHGKDWENGAEEHIMSGNNSEYWLKKIRRNIQHDQEVNDSLKAMNWNVIRFWSRDVIKDPNACVKALKEAIIDNDISLL